MATRQQEALIRTDFSQKDRKLHAQHLEAQSRRTIHLSPARATWKDLVEEGIRQREGLGEGVGRQEGTKRSC